MPPVATSSILMAPMPSPRAVFVRTAAAALLTLAPRAAVAQLTCPASLPLQLYEYDRSLPLEVRDSLLAGEDGVEIRHFSFPSPRGGLATGLLVKPLAPGRHAGIVSFTGFPVRVERARASAAALARTGAVVALVWAPVTRPDGTGTGSPVNFTPDDSAHHVRFVVDARRAVDMLAARPDVDASRLGVVGVSYGGAVAAHLLGVEPRLKAGALVVADAGVISHFTGPDTRGLPEDLTDQERRAWLAAMAPVEGGCYITRSRAALLLQNGSQDRLVPPALARAFHEMVGSAADKRWYDAGHGLNARAEQERLAWLAERLGAVPPASPASGGRRSPERP